MKVLVKREIRKAEKGYIWFKFKTFIKLSESEEEKEFSYYSIEYIEEEGFIRFYRNDLQKTFKNLTWDEILEALKEVKEGYNLAKYYDYDYFRCKYEKKEIKKLTKLYVVWVKKLFKKLYELNKEKDIKDWIIEDFEKEIEL